MHDGASPGAAEPVVAEPGAEAKPATAEPGAAGSGVPSAEGIPAADPVRTPEAPLEKGNAGFKGAPLELGARERREPFVPIAVYEITSPDTLSAVSNIGNAELSDALLSDIAEAISNVPDGSGELSQFGLLYAKRDVMGCTLVAFADASSVSSWQGLATVLAAVGVAALVVFFAASLLFSRWALSPVRQAWERQKRFVSDASHELKTPLAVMAANTAIVQRNAESTVASQSRWIESTETEIEVMRELVDDMLFMASADEGAIEAGPAEPIDLSRLVQAQLLQFESLAFEKSVEVTSQISEDISVVGIRPQLDRLVRTLLDNAFKYVPDGGCVEVRLSCAAQAEGQGQTQSQANGAPMLSVRNTGAPIPPDELPHVFDRFYRADAARTRGAGGYGLGLSIAYDIAQAHGATLSVESDAESGTTFIVAWR